MTIRRILENFLEQLAHIEPARRAACQGPREGLVEDFRPGIIGAPALDEAGVEIDDPVLPHPSALVDAPLGAAIARRRRVGQDLDGEQWDADVSPALETLPRRAADDEDVWLNQGAGAKHDVCGGGEDLERLAALEYGDEVAHQLCNGELVQRAWRRGHDVHPIEQLVPQAVVRQREKLLDSRDGHWDRRHGHNLGLLGRAEQGSTAQHGAPVRPDHHRIVADRSGFTRRRLPE